MPEDFTFRVATGANIAEVFADAPKGVLSFLRRGFNLLATIAPEHYKNLIHIAGANLQSGHLDQQIQSELVSAMKITENEAVTLLATASLVVSVFTQRSDTPEGFVNAAEEVGVLDPASRPAVLAFSQGVLADRENLAVTVQRARLGVQVLPSFEGFSAATDVRLGFKEGRVDLAVPVVVALLRTDSSKNLWFQLTKEQLGKLIAQLQNAARDLEMAEQWIGRGGGGPV